MAAEYVMSLGGWAFLPNLVTNWTQQTYYSITIRAGDPHPAPGTPLYQKHRRNIFTLVIASYLLFTIYQTDWQIQRESDFYNLMGVPFDADEKTIAKQLRRQLALNHPDKVAAAEREWAEQVFIQVRVAHDTLTDPVKRFAYERFGPDMLQWKNCKSMQDYIWQGAQNSGVAILSALVVILIAQAFGQMGHGSYWRYLILAGMLVFELHTMTRAHFPRILTHVLNPLFALSPGHRPYVPFQLTNLVRRTGFSLFVAVNQLAPWYSSAPSSAAAEEAQQNTLISQLRRTLALTQQDSGRLLALEHMPFAGDARQEGIMKERLVEWLVQNEVRNDPAVSAAMNRAIERRNVEMNGDGEG